MKPGADWGKQSRLPLELTILRASSTSLWEQSHLVVVESADLAIIMTNMVEPIKVAANVPEVLTSMRQNPVIPHA